MKIDNDNRKRERFPINQEIELSTSEGQELKTQGINMSEGGLLCKSNEEIPQGTFVKFKLSVPSGENTICMDCEGFILRCVEVDGKYDIVISFND